MGILGPFDNDTAADWTYAFDGAGGDAGLRHIESALRSSTDVGAGEYLDTDVGEEAVAAAEVVAVLRGLAVERTPYNESVFAWTDRTDAVADDALVMLAARALDRVAAADSELADLWEEADDASWRSSIEARRASLQP